MDTRHLAHIETFWRGDERLEARVVVEDGRMEVVIVVEDGAVANGASRHRHTLATEETREDVRTRVAMANSLFRHGGKTPERASLGRG